MANTVTYLKIDPKASVPTIEFYGTFGEGELTPEAFAPKWRALGGPKKVNILLSSPGGSCFAANTIFDMIARSGAEVHVFIDGIAASMGSLIAMLGQRITIGANALMMIHNPTVSMGGGAEDLKRGVALLESIRVRMVSVYAKRTGLSKETIRKMMDAETWMDAATAVRHGFADVVGADLKMAAAAFDLSRFPNAPGQTVPPKSMDEAARQYWAGKGKGQVSANPDDISDLIPAPISTEQAFANFHGRFAGRK